MDESIIKINNISKYYLINEKFSHPTRHNSALGLLSKKFFTVNRKKFWALKNITFDIKKGEIFGIVGRNGAGKSTLLKIMSRITQPSTGDITIKGRVGSLLEIGTGFHQELTGDENIYLSGAILGMTRAEISSKYNEIVEFSGIGKFLNMPVKKYSSGMYVRLAFSIAVHLQPDIFLIDEVLAVGDYSFQRKCLKKINEIRNNGVTILLISHNMQSIEELCDRCLYLKNGKIQALGKTSYVVDKYLGDNQFEGVHDTFIKSKKRFGKGEVYINKIEFKDSKNKLVDKIVSGQSLNIDLEYKSRLNKRYDKAMVNLVFYNEERQRLFKCTTEILKGGSLSLQKNGTIRCHFPKIPMSYGKYDIDVLLTTGVEVQDKIQNAVEINVIDGNFFKTGHVHREWYGLGLLVDHTWKVLRNDN